MIRFLKKIFGGDPTSLLPDLEQYGPQVRPRRRVSPDQKKTTTGDIRDGREWKNEWGADGSSISTRVGANVPKTSAEVVLDEYDAAYLTEICGDNWLKDESRAKVMKWHWLHEYSALRIEQYHTANGKLQRGYSERTAATYIRAFYEADNKREEDGKPRQRLAVTTTTTPNNVFDWE